MKKKTKTKTSKLGSMSITYCYTTGRFGVQRTEDLRKLFARLAHYRAFMLHTISE